MGTSAPSTAAVGVNPENRSYKERTLTVKAQTVSAMPAPLVGEPGAGKICRRWWFLPRRRRERYTQCHGEPCYSRGYPNSSVSVP